jgi:hypothetical protein
MRPLKDTGVRLNQAARNWDAPLKTPQLERKPAEIFEFNDVTAERHCNLAGSYPMAIEMAAILKPEAMVMLMGTKTVSPTLPKTVPIDVFMFDVAVPDGVTIICPVMAELPLDVAMELLG